MANNFSSRLEPERSQFSLITNLYRRSGNQRDLIMMKNCLFALMLTSVTLWMGCARGLKSVATVTVSGDTSVIAVSLTATFKAQINGADSTAVNWSVSGNSCSGSGCGTVSSAGVYTAPTTLPAGTNSMSVFVKATSQADAAAQGQASITVLPITVNVAPPALVQVGQGTVQQFTAVTIPDNAPQTFTWKVSCAQGGSACGAIVKDANTSGLAVYTAPSTPPTGCTSSSCVTVTATSTLNPTAPSSGSANVTVVPSRFFQTYAFRFSGYDNAANRVEMAGSVTFSPSGTGVVTGGVVDEMIASGASKGFHQYSITSGSYVPSLAADNNTNGAGTLTLVFNGSARQFQAVITAVGSMRMIESDGDGTGSGIMQRSAASQFNTSAQKFVFLFTGIDSSGKRVGYIGLLPFDGSGGIAGGLLDVNDAGNNAVVCGLAPCNVTGSYAVDASNSALWHMTLTSGVTLHYDFFIASGQTTAGGGTPLTLYAISTDAVGPISPAVSGTIVYQDSSVTYDKTALKDTAVSHLEGLDSTGSKTVASLTVATGDSNGNISGSFDANNAGTLVAAQNFNCTYTTGTGGRYVITLLGNGTTCSAPALPFVFYASGASRGFLLDQSSTAVMAGAMNPQAKSLSSSFAGSELPGIYTAATIGGGISGVTPLAANLTLTYPGFQSGLPVYNAVGTFYDPAIEPLATGTYSVQTTGAGSLALTPSGAAHADNYVFYATDLTHFWMIPTQDTSGNVPQNPSVIEAQQ
jgi:hypothetical protein